MFKKFDLALGLMGITLGIALILALFFALPVMWLWNTCLVPAVPGIQEISWLQALGLYLLANLLFKNAVNAK